MKNYKRIMIVLASLFMCLNLFSVPAVHAETYEEDFSKVSLTFKDLRTDETCTFNGKADKPQVIVFGGIGSCQITSGIMTYLGGRDFNIDEYNLYVVDIKNNTTDTITKYMSSFPSSIHVSTLSGFNSLYSRVRSYAKGNIMPFVAYIDTDGIMRGFNEGAAEFSEVEHNMNLIGVSVKDDSVVFDLPIMVQFRQTDARKELQMINEFRTGEDAWYWNSDNETKTVLSDLPELKYDYDLEKVAMQRAVEIAVLYSHTRADDESCFTTYDDLGYHYMSAGENIAAGQSSVAQVFNAWLESDEMYDGQGHRRNMLNEKYKAVGVACVLYNGYYYWVQEFSGAVQNNTATVANDSESVETVKVNSDNIDMWSLSNYDLTMEEGDTVNLSEFTTLMYEMYNATFTPQRQSRPCVVNLEWESEDSSIANYNSGLVTAVGAGTTWLNTLTPDGKKQLSIKISVKSTKPHEHQYEFDSFLWDEVDRDEGIIPAQYICKICDEKATVNGQLSSEITKQATCVREGQYDEKAYISADISLDGLEHSDIYGWIISPLGHDYVYEGMIWEEDNTKAHAHLVCSRDSSHVLDVEATISTYYDEEGNEVTEATARYGWNTYTDKKVTYVTMDAPSISSSSMNTNGVTLKWSTVTGADEYVVYRKQGTGSYEEVGRSTTASYTDGTALAGTKYTYAIKAHNTTTGKYSDYSAEKTLTYNPFKDVKSTSAHYKNIMWAFNKGLVNGTSKTTFSPEGTCMRKSFAIMLWKLNGRPAASGTNPFTDIDGLTSNEKKAIQWCYKNKIVSGMTKTTFSPEGDVTRKAVVIMLWKAAGRPAVVGSDNPFTDISKLSANEKSAILWAYENGITKGTTKTTFGPEENCTREQLCTFLARYNNLLHIMD